MMTVFSGVVDQINQDKATIEYEIDNAVYYTTVSIKDSDCVPKEGERVRFAINSKIYECRGTNEW